MDTMDTMDIRLNTYPKVVEFLSTRPQKKDWAKGTHDRYHAAIHGLFEFDVFPFTFRVWAPSNRITDVENMSVLLMDYNGNTVHFVEDPLFGGIKDLWGKMHENYPAWITLDRLCGLIIYVDRIRDLMSFA